MPRRPLYTLPAALLALVACVSSATEQECVADRTDERARVAMVYDGDTVRLADGRKLRLIGLDTPEMDHGGAAAQPYAEQARSSLNDLLAEHPFIRLRYDAVRQDRYQRTLAHVYLEDGRSVTALLIEQGLATALTVPPDLWNHTCYQAAEQRARAARRGIWSLPSYQPVASTALAPGAEGFHRIRGRVTRVSESRGSVWLALEGNVALRIARDDLHYFSTPPEQWRGRTLTVRGWPHADTTGRLVIRVRHPAALEIAD
ncbi:MAG: thermonuclease family protein [Gammaproteobacteria bacterium]|nr:thermonuclease family protein [Gammaproteobacteria bacterium]